MRDPIVVGEFRKNAREIVRVALDEFNGHDLISLRVFFDAGDGSMRPGKSGLACRVGLLPELSKAVNSALEQARDLGLLRDGGGK